MFSSSTMTQVTKQTKKRPSKGGRKVELASNTPVFLRKTYTMIDTCNSSIACWSDDGSTFVVKDTEKFAFEVIPEFFKHNNFSSFVRQLNFYGFRKIKADPLRIKEAEISEESKYWKFRHDKFQRGRPDLLAEIRKSTHNENAEKHEVETLKNEVSALKESISNMNRDMEKLTSIVSTFMQTQPSYAPEYGAAKKRKRMHGGPPSPVRSTDLADTALDPIPIGSMYDVGLGGVDPCVSGSLGPANPVGRTESAGAIAFTPQDDEILSSLFALDPTEEINILDNCGVPDLTLSMMTKPAAEVDPVLVDQLRGAVSKLPKEMQKMFVDRIVAAIAEPERFKQQVDAMTSLATSAAAEAKRRLASAGLSPEDPKCVALASAVLGAYMSRYSVQQAPESAAFFSQI